MDKRLKKLSIKLPKGWKDASRDDPDGPPTFINDIIEDSGVLQISTAEFLSGKIPDPDPSDLIGLSKNIGLKNEFGELKNEASGNCSYGTYDCAQFSNSEFPHVSIWHLSDGRTSYSLLLFAQRSQINSKLRM